MSEEEKKMDRRTYAKYAGTAIIAAAVGGAVGYTAKKAPPAPGVGPTQTVTQTVTRTVTAAAPGAAPGLGQVPILPPGVRNPYIYDELKGAEVKALHDAFAGRILEWYDYLLEEEAGVKIGLTKLVDIPMLKDEGMSLLEAKATDFPLIQITPSFIADFSLTGKIEPLDDYYKRFYKAITPEYNEYLTQVLPPYVEFYMKYKGKIWTIPFDGDVHLWNYLVPFYTKDEFKNEYKNWHPDRKPLTLPETWDDYIMQCKFFAEKVLPDDKKTIPGATVLWPTMITVAPPWGWAFFYNFAASYGVSYFDKNMEHALWPREKAVEALKKVVELVPYCPEGVASFGTSETVEYWLAGKVISQIWWIDINEWGQVDPVKGKLANHLMPGYPDPEKGVVVHRAMMPYNRTWVIPNYLDEKTKKAAFYVAFHVSHWDYSIYQVADYDCGMDPYMYVHYTDYAAWQYTKSNPLKRPSEEWPHTEPLFPTFEMARKHLDGGLANMAVGYPQPTFPGTIEFQESLSREFQQAMGGKDPAKAIDDAASSWEDTRDKYMGIVGKDEYLAIWKDFNEKMMRLGYI